MACHLDLFADRFVGSGYGNWFEVVNRLGGKRTEKSLCGTFKTCDNS